MKVGLKKRSAFGVKRFGFEAKVERIEKTRSGSVPNRDVLTIFFRGLEGMGFFTMTPSEFDELREHIHPKRETAKKKKKAVQKKASKKKSKKQAKKKK
jgi:stringent starvation protein B